MKLWSDSFKDNSAIPGEFAFCVIDPATHVAMSSNRNPHLAWSELPTNTRSLVILCNDPDVPSRGDDVNQEGRVIPASLPRVDFCHWALIDLPVSLKAIQAGEFSDGITARGKPGPMAAHGARQGVNDYTAWFAGDAQMAGDYHGYDGPCPPWNDALLHHYVFTLYALSIDRLDVPARFTGTDVLKAMAGKILGQAALTGLYSLNPAVKY